YPCLAEDLGRREVPVGMVEEELQELELSLGQCDLAALVPDYAPFGIQPQSVQLPEAAVPEVEALLVALHLGFDNLEVPRRGLLCERLQVGDVAVHPGKNAPFELEQIGIDAHPVARVFPARGLDVLTLERLRSPWLVGTRLSHERRTLPIRTGISCPGGWGSKPDVSKP